MEYALKDTSDLTKIQFTGRVTFEDNNTFKAIIAQLSDKVNHSVILDLNDVDLVDSAGLGLLLRVQSEVEQHNCDVAMRIPGSGPVKRLMDVARFGELIPVVS